MLFLGLRFAPPQANLPGADGAENLYGASHQPRISPWVALSVVTARVVLTPKALQNIARGCRVLGGYPRTRPRHGNYPEGVEEPWVMSRHAAAGFTMSLGPTPRAAYRRARGVFEARLQRAVRWGQVSWGCAKCA